MATSKFPGILLRGKNSIQIQMFFEGARETETLRMEHSTKNQKLCYGLKLAAEQGYKDKNLDYGKLFPRSKNKHKYVSRRGDNITIVTRLDERFERLIQDRRKGLKSDSTVDTYRNEIERLKTYFNEFHPSIKLSELETGHLKTWAKFRNVSQKAINEELKHLRAIISEAISDNELDQNILYGWKPQVTGQVVIGVDDQGQQIIKSKYDRDPFTPEETNRILESTKILYPEIYSFNLFRCSLGMRPSEIRGLEWSRYNELENSILVMKVIVKNKVKEFPKTQAGIRPLILNKAAQQAISIQKALTYQEGGYIFTNPAGIHPGKFWGEGAICKRWRKILKHADVRHRRPYNTRHSFATQCLESNNVSIFELSKLLGHNDTKTVDKYAGGQKELTPLDTSGVDNVIKLS